ncbi:MAG: MotA/TolQ/ExbB proton channel family protein [Bacteroidales bacterium]|jgi:biopolymer transport protein ExbB|nr:MotA/TolQ/ExbB proton channel family protein [Bacteroidales bacterium]
MKKVFALLAITGILTFGASFANAQDPEAEQPTQVEQTVQETTPAPAAQTSLFDGVEEDKAFHQVLKEKFIEGGVGWMAPILILLIIGLALCIERMIYLGLSQANTKKLLANIEDLLRKGEMEEAKELCRNTRGPVAGIFYQGLDRYDGNLDDVEKAITSYGGVMMGNLEKGTSWITLFIALAPSLGFLGTVIGLVQAFDNIERVGDISPTIVAGGMKVALLTTVFGLIVAMVLQVFYNFVLSKIESIVNDMEDSSITFMDILAEYHAKN